MERKTSFKMHSINTRDVLACNWAAFADTYITICTCLYRHIHTHVYTHFIPQIAIQIKKPTSCYFYSEPIETYILFGITEIVSAL